MATFSPFLGKIQTAMENEKEMEAKKKEIEELKPDTDLFAN